MSDINVWVGNTAPTTSARRPATAEDAAAAGPLGSKEVESDGTEKFFVLEQQPMESEQAITHFVIPHSASIVNAIKDLGLAFSSVHSAAPAAWVHAGGDHIMGPLAAQHLGSLAGVDVPHLSVAELDDILAGPMRPDGSARLGGGAIQAIGRDLWAQSLGDVSGAHGTSTGSAATTLTDTGQGWTTNQWANHDVVVGQVVGTIASNTATAVTIARWETPGARSGATASTPGATSAYTIAGQAPAAWVALTANTATPTTGGADLTLTAEIATGGGGLIRAVASYAHTPGATTYSLTNTFTANGSDALPVVIAKIGVFSASTGGRLLFETLLASTATLNNPGDNIQCIDTVTGT